MDEIISRIIDLKNQKEKILIAIDGFGGAGKSSLARNLLNKVENAIHIELDWYHLPRKLIKDEKRFDFTRFKNEVVFPFLDGKNTLKLNKYNWGYLANKPEELIQDSVSIDNITTLIVEGVMSLSKELADTYDLRIWIGADASKSNSRGIKRDIEEYGLREEDVLPAWKEWAKWEEECLRVEDRRNKADFML